MFRYLLHSSLVAISRRGFTISLSSSSSRPLSRRAGSARGGTESRRGRVGSSGINATRGGMGALRSAWPRVRARADRRPVCRGLRHNVRRHRRASGASLVSNRRAIARWNETRAGAEIFEKPSGDEDERNTRHRCDKSQVGGGFRLTVSPGPPARGRLSASRRGVVGYHRFAPADAAESERAQARCLNTGRGPPSDRWRANASLLARRAPPARAYARLGGVTGGDLACGRSRHSSSTVPDATLQRTLWRGRSSERERRADRHLPFDTIPLSKYMRLLSSCLSRATSYVRCAKRRACRGSRSA